MKMYMGKEETKVVSNNHHALISIIIVVIAVIALVVSPIVAPILSLLGLVAAWRARILTQPHTNARNIANTALLLSTLLIIAEIGMYLYITPAQGNPKVSQGDVVMDSIFAMFPL
ncbi:MAG: hypothetical protein AB1743_05750 [Actinomycetota bacterium]